MPCLGVKGHKRSNFVSQNFLILTADSDSLQKSMKRCFYFFHFQQLNSRLKSQNSERLQLPYLEDCNAEFDCVPIKQGHVQCELYIAPEGQKAKVLHTYRPTDGDWFLLSHFIATKNRKKKYFLMLFLQRIQICHQALPSAILTFEI